MTGTSYNGTIPLAAAVTGVEGLEAIIPIAPNTSYYHYYRSNGLVRHPGGWLGEDIDFLYDFINSGDPARRDYCNARYRDGEFASGRDRAHGDYNDFWATRDLLPKVKNIKAAVLMAHAFNDWNVVPEHSVRIYEALKGRVPLQAYYHQGGHGGAPPLEMMNKWFTRYLYGVENGVENEPKAWIVRETNRRGAATAGRGAAPPAAGRGRGRGATPPPTPYADYPNPAAVRRSTLHLTAGGGRARRAWRRRQRQQAAAGEARRQRGVGRRRRWRRPSRRRHRLLYATPELDRARASLRHGASDAAAGVEQAGGESLGLAGAVLPWTDGPIGPANLITRGWADPQNHDALTSGGDYHSKKRRRAARAGQVLHDDVRSTARRSDHSGRQAHRPDDLVERPRLHAVAEARDRAHDRPRQVDAHAAGGRRCRGLRDGGRGQAVNRESVSP